MKEDVDVVLSADELLLRFHETTNNVLAQKGLQRIGVALYVNEKYECSVMITYLSGCKSDTNKRNKL